MNLPPEISFASPEVKAHYIAMIEDGQSPAFAEMCALRQPPGTKGSERAFMEGRYNGEWLNQMPERQAKYILAEAKAAGISTSGRYYCAGIADKRGWCDPAAWIEDSSDMLKVAKARNLEVKGSVNYTPPEREPERVGLDEGIVDRMAEEKVKKDPSLSKLEAKAQVREKHTPQWAKGRKKRNK